jgi:hypothetical protein
MKACSNKPLLIAWVICALWFGATPAVAANNLECLLSLRNKSSDDIIFAAYQSGTLSEALKEQHGPGISACVKQNQWSRSAAESAFDVFFNEILIAGVKADFVRQRLPADRLVAWLEAYIKTLPSAKLEQFANNESVESDLVVMASRLIRDGVISESQFTEDSSLWIAQYVALRAKVIINRERFKGQ